MHRMRFHDSPIMAASLPHDSDVVCFWDYNAFLHFEMVLLLFQYNFLLHVYEIHEMYYFPEVLSLLLQQSFPHVLHKKKPFPLNSDIFISFYLCICLRHCVRDRKHPLTSCISICKYCCFGYSVSLTFAILATVALSFKLINFTPDVIRPSTEIELHSIRITIPSVLMIIISLSSLTAFTPTTLPVFFRNLIAFHTFSTTILRCEFFHCRTFTHTFFQIRSANGFPVYEAAFRLLHRDPQDSFHELP